MFFRKKRAPQDSFQEVNRELERIGSKLQVKDRNASSKNRMTRIFLNYIEFWENGIKWYGVQGVKNPHDMALLIHYWNECCMCSHQIEAEFPDLKFPVARKKIEQGEAAYLDWFWEKQCSKKDRRFAELIELCASNQVTRRLISYIQLRDFGFSRSIGTMNGVELRDLPRVRVTDEWEYEVRTPTQARAEYAGKSPRDYLGKGNAEEAFRLLLQYFPPDCGPATYQRGRGCCPPAA